MTSHLANLRRLIQPIDQLEASLPSITSANEKGLDDLRRIVAKVEEMSSQRTMLVDQLRAAVHNDDITQILIGSQRSKIDCFIFGTANLYVNTVYKINYCLYSTT